VDGEGKSFIVFRKWGRGKTEGFGEGGGRTEDGGGREEGGGEEGGREVIDANLPGQFSSSFPLSSDSYRSNLQISNLNPQSSILNPQSSILNPQTSPLARMLLRFLPVGTTIGNSLRAGPFGLNSAKQQFHEVYAPPLLTATYDTLVTTKGLETNGRIGTPRRKSPEDIFRYPPWRTKKTQNRPKKGKKRYFFSFFRSDFR
jgi:hypothetical protein